MRRQGRRSTNRARRDVGAWAVAVALGAATAAAPSAYAAADAPAAGAVGTAGMGVVPGAAGAPVPFLGDSHPGPGGPGGPPPAAPAPDAPGAPDAPEAPDADSAPEAAPAPNVPRPITQRPGAGGTQVGASAATLAVRGLTVRAEVPLAAAREHGIPVAFVPRQGALIADVRLYAIAGGSRRLVVSLVVPARAARRTTVRLQPRAVRRGAYQIAVQAGAGPRTLGPAVTARVRIV